MHIFFPFSVSWLIKLLFKSISLNFNSLSVKWGSVSYLVKCYTATAGMNSSRSMLSLFVKVAQLLFRKISLIPSQLCFMDTVMTVLYHQAFNHYLMFHIIILNFIFSYLTFTILYCIYCIIILCHTGWSWRSCIPAYQKMQHWGQLLSSDQQCLSKEFFESSILGSFICRWQDWIQILCWESLRIISISCCTFLDYIWGRYNV